MTRGYDAFLLTSFGGPEGPDDVMPFLQNVTHGRGIPRERLEEVSHHYLALGGVSPINDQNRALIAALETEFARRAIALPVYWGNRNWAPFLADTMRALERDGRRHVLAFVTSPYSSYSSCRQYREDLAAHYAEQTGRSLEHLTYYMVLAQFKLGVIMERQYARILNGRQTVEVAGDAGAFVTRLIGKAYAMTKGEA